MTKQRFPGRLHGDIQVDLCFACQAIWFDTHENLQLTPAGVIELFRQIHVERDTPRLPLPGVLHCPRCSEPLRQGMDLAKPGGRFNYLRCPQQHGRFTPFSQFLIEKGFVRQLNPAEIAKLAAEIRQIRCNGCGAPIKLQQDPACPHCRAPIALLDPQAVNAALARYQTQAASAKAKPEINHEALGDLIIARERARNRRQQEAGLDWKDGGELIDLLVDGASLLFRWLD